MKSDQFCRQWRQNLHIRKNCELLIVYGRLNVLSCKVAKIAHWLWTRVNATMSHLKCKLPKVAQGWLPAQMQHCQLKCKLPKVAQFLTNQPDSSTECTQCTIFKAFMQLYGENPGKYRTLRVICAEIGYNYSEVPAWGYRVPDSGLRGTGWLAGPGWLTGTGLRMEVL